MYLIESKTIEDESDYLVEKIYSNRLFYIYENDDYDNIQAYPVFKDTYYFSFMVNDKFVRTKVPYEVYSKYSIGDHFFIKRDVISYTLKDSFLNKVRKLVMKDNEKFKNKTEIKNIEVKIENIYLPTEEVTNQFNSGGI